MTDRSTLRPTRRQAAAGISALAALWLSGCSGSDGSDASTEDASAEPADGTDPPAGEEGSGADDGSDQAPTDKIESSTAVDLDDAVATLSHPILTADIEGTMTVGLHHLRVRGETMELLLTFTPEFTGHETYNLYELYGGNGNNFWPILFDRVNLKRYDVLTSGATPWFTEDQAFRISSGDTQPFWANFATPVDDIDVLDVGIATGPYFEDVPIDRGSASPSDGGGSEDGEE